jgi:GH24 family phage-related lysozyme (muramidase)
MSPKPNLTITSRFLEEGRPLAVKQVPSPYPDPPPGRGALGRLCFRGPSPKLDLPIADLAQIISTASLHDAVFFLDTNIFTKELDLVLWRAFCTRRIFIAPAIWEELLPWLKSPFCNQTIRDSVVAAAQSQVARASGTRVPADPQIEVLRLNEDFTKHGYEYYLKLLALRKVMGPLATAVLTKRFGRAPTQNEFLAEVQGNLGGTAEPRVATDQSERGKEFLEYHEGINGQPNLKPYDKDGSKAGNCTIGWGSKIHDGPCKPGDFSAYANFTVEAAEQLLFQDVELKALSPIKQLVHVGLAQRELDALLDFTFNVGGGNAKTGKGGLASSQLLQQLNTGNYKQASNGFLGWLVPASIKGRRVDEKNLWDNGDYTSNGHPIP